MLHAASSKTEHPRDRADRSLQRLGRNSCFAVASCPPDEDGTRAFAKGAVFTRNDVTYGLRLGAWPEGMVFTLIGRRMIVRDGALVDERGAPVANKTLCSYLEPCSRPRHKSSKYCQEHMRVMRRQSHSAGRMCVDCGQSAPVYHSTLCAACTARHYRAKLDRNNEKRRARRRGALRQTWQGGENV